MEPMTLELLAALAEPKLADATSGDLSHAVMPLTGNEARAYLLGRSDVLQWVIEMCG